MVLKALNIFLLSVSAVLARLESLHLNSKLSLWLLSVQVVVPVIFVDHVASLTVLIAELLIVQERLGPFIATLFVVRNHPLLKDFAAISLLPNVLVVFFDSHRLSLEQISGLRLVHCIGDLGHSLFDGFGVHTFLILKNLQ
jgi:hypothetical protein